MSPQRADEEATNALQTRKQNFGYRVLEVRERGSKETIIQESSKGPPKIQLGLARARVAWRLVH